MTSRRLFSDTTGMVSEYELVVDRFDYPSGLQDTQSKIQIFLDDVLENFVTIKFRVNLEIIMEKALPPHDRRHAMFRSKMQRISMGDNIEDIVGEKIEKIMNSIEKYTENGSGYRVKEIIKTLILVAKIIL